MPLKPENLIGKGNRFTAENQPEGRGRRRNLFTRLKGKFNLSQGDLENIVTFLCSQTVDKLKEIMLDPKQPVIIVAFARAIQADIQKGSITSLSALLDRRLGKPKQAIAGIEDEPLLIKVIKSSELNGEG